MRRHGGTMAMACGLKRRDFKKMRALLAAAGICVPDMTRLKRCGFFGGAMSKRERLRRAKGGKKSVYPIGDGEKEKKRKKQELRQKRGPRWDSNPRVYEREIGPNHLRKGRHEPSSYACDRGHRGYKHTDTTGRHQQRWRYPETRSHRRAVVGKRVRTLHKDR
jgi:hypothetical protein